MYRYLNGFPQQPLCAGFSLLVILLVAASCGDRGERTRTRAPQPVDVAPAPQQDDALRVVSRAEPLPAEFAPLLIELPRELAAPPAGQLLLTQSAALAVEDLLVAAKAAGLELRVLSAYRSFADQERLFVGMVERVGEARAAAMGTPPGTSEHQLGTAVDFAAASTEWMLSERFDSSAESRWLREHAHEFGFALSYPPNADAVTGQAPEPWHYRYIGREHAARWRDSGTLLITYLRSAS